MMRFAKALLLFAAVLFTGCATEEIRCDKGNLPDKLNRPKIVVKKSLRRLYLFDGEILAGEYPIGLGFSPVGHKQKEGDGATPEGDYYVCTRNAKSRFYKSLGVSYPNIEDAARGLEKGLITQAEYEEIKCSIELKQCPDWHTALGGEICIHGNGATDWTAGCVAVENDVMDVLWTRCPIGTELRIEP